MKMKLAVLALAVSYGLGQPRGHRRPSQAVPGPGQSRHRHPEAVPHSAPSRCLDPAALRTTGELHYTVQASGSFSYKDAACHTFKTKAPAPAQGPSTAKVTKQPVNVHGKCSCAGKKSSYIARCAGTALVFEFYSNNKQCHGIPVRWINSNNQCLSQFGFHAKLSWNTAQFTRACAGHGNPTSVATWMNSGRGGAGTCAEETNDHRSDLCIKTNCCSIWQRTKVLCAADKKCMAIVNMMMKQSGGITTLQQAHLICSYSSPAVQALCLQTVQCASTHNCWEDAHNKCSAQEARDCSRRCIRCLPCAKRSWGGACHGHSASCRTTDGQSCSSCTGCNGCVQYIDCMKRVPAPPAVQHGSQCADRQLTHRCGRWADPLHHTHGCTDLSSAMSNWKHCLKSTHCWNAFYQRAGHGHGHGHLSTQEACKFGCLKFKARRSSCNVNCDQYCERGPQNMVQKCGRVTDVVGRCTSGGHHQDACQDLMPFTIAEFLDDCVKSHSCVHAFATFITSKLPCLHPCHSNRQCLKMVETVAKCYAQVGLKRITHNRNHHATGAQRALQNNPLIACAAKHPQETTMVLQYAATCASSGLFSPGHVGQSFLEHTFHATTIQGVWQDVKNEFCSKLGAASSGRGGTSFRLLPGKYSWARSRVMCRHLGAGWDLASIHSARDGQALHRLTHGKTCWIGINDILHEGHFVWADGTPVNYHNWNRGEPNNYHGQEDCTQLYGNNLANWNDLNCNQHLQPCCSYHRRQAGPAAGPRRNVDQCSGKQDLSGQLCHRMVAYMQCSTYMMTHTCAKTCCKKAHHNSPEAVPGPQGSGGHAPSVAVPGMMPVALPSLSH